MPTLTTRIARLLRLALALFMIFSLTGVTALAQRHRGNVRSSSRSNVHNRNTNVNRNVNRNTNVNRNRNVNRNIDIDRDIDVDIDVDRRGGCCYHSGWGTAAAVATTAVVTAAVVGSRVNTLPPACSVVMVNGFAYQQCGTVWYQPQLAGSSTTYIVVNAPR
jgi:hypothetical protein